MKKKIKLKKHEDDIFDIINEAAERQPNKSNEEIINDYIQKKISKKNLDDFREFASQFDKFNFQILKDFIQKYPVEIHLSKKTVYKRNLIFLVATHFFYKKDFENLCNILPDFFSEMLIESVWRKRVNIKFYEKKYDVVFISPNSSSWNPKWLVDEVFLFDVLNNKNIIQLSDFLVDHLQKFVTKPKLMKLTYDSKTEKLVSITKYHYKVNFTPDWILTYIVKFVESDFFQLTKSNKLTKKTIKTFKEQTSLISFFEKDTFISEQMLLVFLLNFSGMKKKTNLNQYKTMLDNYMNSRSSSYNIEHQLILQHINFSYNSINSKFRKTFISILKKLPIEKWISFSQIQTYCDFHSIDSDCYLDYYNPDLRLKDVYDQDNKFVYSSSSLNYDAELIFYPLFKGSLFLFATLGIVEIVYDEPINKIYTKSELPYLTSFDGLKAVKLTTFGAFALGKIQKYSNVKKKKDKSKITFSPKTLTIELNQPDILKQMEVSGFTKQLSPTVFEVNYKTMLDNCNNEAEFHLKITKLKAIFGKKKQKNWIDFIAELEQKSNLIKRDFSYEVFQLGNNTDLLNLIIRDIVLKKLIYKAENKIVLVKANNFQKFKNRLKEFGYFF